ncbi:MULTISPECIES: helix-turn-helix domain-containing protein [Micrococcus]|nr:helix-turn-helix domain-containing protein [Micrococcus luteus]
MKWAQKVAETGQLNTGQAFVLLLLGDHADEAWSCHPSQELLARRSAQTVRSVERHIARLRDLGLVDTESRYGDGRGRIGLRYYLREEALNGLVQDPETRMNTRPDNLSGKSETRMNTRPDNLSGKSETRMNTRPDNLSGKSETRMNTRPDNLSGESTQPTISADSPDNYDFADYKDRARTNPQEPSSVRPSVRQSGAVRAETTTDDGRRTTDRSGHRRWGRRGAGPSGCGSGGSGSAGAGGCGPRGRAAAVHRGRGLGAGLGAGAQAHGVRGAVVGLGVRGVGRGDPAPAGGRDSGSGCFGAGA